METIDSLKISQRSYNFNGYIVLLGLVKLFCMVDNAEVTMDAKEGSTSE